MRDAAYDRKVICDALHVDKTQVSRMLSVADAVPLAVIEAIGSAPSVGRDRWLTLAKLLSDTATDADGAVALVAAAKTHGSDERFAALMRALRQPRSKPTDAAPEAETVSGALRNREGAEIGRLSRRGGKITLTLPEAEAAGFDRWLMENFDRLHGDWLASRPDKDR